MSGKSKKHVLMAMALMVFVPIWTLSLPSAAQQTRPLPVFPQAVQAGPTGSEESRADVLSRLVCAENHRLVRDGCLATQAFMRAKRMSMAGYFDHEDPKTGKNPVWRAVRLCVHAHRPWVRAPAGENLSKGHDTPDNIHTALMASPGHRKNILDPRFNHVGVGCYGDICVELFAGF
ncbi:MAG TPA: CAP domain-containing protein [Syntrophobacteraceae bacterium]|nr:CAP domain-containing protein [Syntrophobacteraceae bacterium]